MTKHPLLFGTSRLVFARQPSAESPQLRFRSTPHFSLGSCVGLVVMLTACGGGSVIPPVQLDTDGDGIETGIVEEGADTTAGGPPQVNGCIYDDELAGEAEGLVHQCSAEYDVDLTFDFLPIVGDAIPGNIMHTAVQTAAPPSSYEHPFAAACCSDIEEWTGWSPGDDTCGLPHHGACYSDLVQHLCALPSAMLFDAASEHTNNGAIVLQEASDWFHDHINDCYRHFWDGTDSLHAADYCGSDFDSFYNHPAWEPDVSFTFVEPLTSEVLAAVGNFSLSPSTKFHNSGVLPLPAQPATCEGPVDNEGEVPPLAEASDGAVTAILAADVNSGMMGPRWMGEMITGSGAFGGASRLRYSNGNSSIDLEQLVMFEASPTVAGTSTVEVDIDAFKLQLLSAKTAQFDGRLYTVAAGNASFILNARTADVSGFVTARNSSDIDLYFTVGGVGACPTSATQCLVSRSFSIEYTDGSGESWELDINAATWVP